MSLKDQNAPNVSLSQLGNTKRANIFNEKHLSQATVNFEIFVVVLFWSVEERTPDIEVKSLPCLVYSFTLSLFLSPRREAA